MYRGVNLDGISVTDYASALAAYEQRSTKRRARFLDEHNDWALGHPKAGVTGVRKGPDGAIIFRLYETDVITWEPDGSVWIDNYGTVTTSAFASALLPAGIHVAHDVKRNPMFGDTIENRTITYRTASPVSPWSSDPRYGHEDVKRYREEVRCSTRICNAERSPVRFVLNEYDFLVPDDDTVTPMKVPVLDRKGAREVSKRYALGTFRTYLEVARPHFFEPLEHEDENYSVAAEALLERNFKRAAQHLPRVEDKASYGQYPKPLKIEASPGIITMRSFEMLKDHIYDDEGLFSKESFATLPYGAWVRARRRTAALESAGVYL